MKANKTRNALQTRGGMRDQLWCLQFSTTGLHLHQQWLHPVALVVQASFAILRLDRGVCSVPHQVLVEAQHWVEVQPQQADFSAQTLPAFSAVLHKQLLPQAIKKHTRFRWQNQIQHRR
jgi:hypothetical protein